MRVVGIIRIHHIDRIAIMHHPPMLLVVILLSFSVRLVITVECEQHDTGERSCFFVCSRGYERNLVARLERMWLAVSDRNNLFSKNIRPKICHNHQNRTCNQQHIAFQTDATILFENSTLKSNWFHSGLSVIELVMDLRHIVAIQTGAFSTQTFRTLINLQIQHLSSIVHLHSGIFDGLESLQLLYFSDFHCHNIATPQWLRPVSTTLETLWVRGPISQRPYNLNALTSDVSLVQLREIRYSLNLNGSLSGRTFRGLRAVETLRLDSCQIEHIGAATFDPLVGSLRLLDLRENRLRQLPDGIFDRLLAQPGAAELKTVWLSGNPWDCRCGLAYVQFQLQAHAQVFVDEPARCRTPSSVTGQPVARVKFCVNGKDAVFEKVVRCSNAEKSRTEDTEIAFSQNPFHVRKRDEITKSGNAIDTLEVWHLHEQLEWPWLFLRFVDGRDSVDAMDCVWGTSMKHRLQMHRSKADDFDKIQLMCMLRKTKSPETISPLDCTSVFLPRVRNSEAKSNEPRAWLTRVQRPVVITLLMLLMLGICGLGAAMVAIAISLGMLRQQHSQDIDARNRTSSADGDDSCGDAEHYVEVNGCVALARSTQKCSTLSDLSVYESSFDVVPPTRHSNLPVPTPN